MRRAALLLTIALLIAANADILDNKWADSAFAHNASIAPKKQTASFGAGIPLTSLTKAVK